MILIGAKAILRKASALTTALPVLNKSAAARLESKLLPKAPKTAKNYGIVGVISENLETED